MKRHWKSSCWEAIKRFQNIFSTCVIYFDRSSYARFGPARECKGFVGLLSACIYSQHQQWRWTGSFRLSFSWTMCAKIIFRFILKHKQLLCRSHGWTSIFYGDDIRHEVPMNNDFSAFRSCAEQMPIFDIAQKYLFSKQMIKNCW